jgi:hypothetical protein
MENVKLSYLPRNAAAASLLVTSKSELKADTTKKYTNSSNMHRYVGSPAALEKEKKGEEKLLSSGHGQWR